ncbi:intracellular coagulation inhibitor 2-like, partial [Physella acuta]|uniref:intracellular coagulation inhibitor 2-like n=1 Tax=Physella acuta TaxID=109671 RepID=UPI0027DCD29B
MKSLTVLIIAIAGQLVSGDQLKTLAAATSDFSQRLYQKVALDTPNVVYSPYSIHSAMSMALLGAREETAKEMETTLGVTSLGAATHNIYKDLIHG